MSARITVALVATLVCARAAHAQSRIWRPDDRVTISSFNDVAAVAYDGRRVFGVTANGVEIYDEMMQRWLLPSTIEDEFPIFARATSALYDRSQAGLWVQTGAGTYFLSDLSQRWESRPFNRDALTSIDQSGSHNSDAALSIVTRTAMDTNGRRWQVTSAIPAERQGTYWVGTAGGNLIFTDTRNLSSDFKKFGTLTRGVTAIAIGKDGSIWYGGDGMGPRDGITQSDASLQNWTWYEPFTTRAPRGPITRFVMAGDTTWAASSDGVYEYDTRTRAWRRIGEREGLVSDNVAAIAKTSYGIWAGTSHGLAVIDAVTLRVKWSGMTGARIAGVAARGDELWAASDAGLFVAVIDTSGVTLRQPRAAETDPVLRGRIDDVATWRDSVFVIANRTVYVLDEAGGSSIVNDAALAAIGRAYELRADDQGVYVIGTQGVARRGADGQWNYLTIPTDIPAAPVADVVSAGEFIWVATPVGATRLKWP